MPPKASNRAVQQGQLATPLVDKGEKLAHDPMWRGTVPNEARQWNDVPFIPAFLVTMIACIVGGIALRSHYDRLDPVAGFGDFDQSGSLQHRADSITANDRVASAVILATSAAGVIVWLLLVRFVTPVVVYGSLIFWSILMAAITGFAFVVGAWQAGILCALGLVCVVIYVVIMWSQIPLAIVFIREGARAIFQNGMLVLVVVPLVSLVGLVGLIGIVYSLFFVAQVSTTATILFSLFSLFCLWWMVEAIRSVKTVSIAHTVASWYIQRRSRGATTVSAFTGLSLAVSKHAGTVLAGALLVAIFAFLRTVAEHGRRRSGGGVAGLAIQLIACCIWCLLRLVEVWVRYITRYAMIYVAIHGENFCSSCKRAFNLFERAGCQNFTNDVVTRIMIGASMFSIVGAAFGLGLLVSEVSHANFFHFVPLVSLGAGFALAFIYCETLITAVDTIFVSYLEDIERNVQVGQAIHCSPEWQDAVVRHAKATSRMKSVPMPPPFDSSEGSYVALHDVVGTQHGTAIGAAPSYAPPMAKTYQSV